MTSDAHRWRTRRLGWLVSLVLALALLPAAAQAAVRTPTLEVTPGEGPPGAEVVATATGFGACLEVDEAFEPFSGENYDSLPLETDPGAEPSPGPFDDVGPVLEPGRVQFAWGQVPLATVGVAEAAEGVTVVVPVEAEPGPSAFSATCVENPKLLALTEFTVVAPESVPVPDVRGMTLDEATEMLQEVGLGPGTTTGEGERVTDQSPPPDTEVEAGTPVDLVLTAPVEVPNLTDLTVRQARTELAQAGLRLGRVTGEGTVVRSQSREPGSLVPPGTPVGVVVTLPPPEPVVVPDLRGLDLDAARSELQRAGLRLGGVRGRGDQVSSQSPNAGREVPPGSRVSVALAPIPPELVTVPDLAGDTVAEAEETLARVGLQLEAPRDASGTVATQRPGVGAQVPVGTAVAVTLEPLEPVARPFDPARWTLLGLLAVVLALLLLSVQRVVQNRASERWVRTHVRAAPGRGVPLDSTAPVATGDEPGPTHTVRLAPRHDPGTSTTEET